MSNYSLYNVEWQYIGLPSEKRQKLVDIICEESAKGKYKFITDATSDKNDGRCSWGLILTHYGWDGDSNDNKSWFEGMNALADDFGLRVERQGRTTRYYLPNEINDITAANDRGYWKDRDGKMRFPDVQDRPKSYLDVKALLKKTWHLEGDVEAPKGNK
jgi:beta-xylosidase